MHTRGCFGFALGSSCTRFSWTSSAPKSGRTLQRTDAFLREWQVGVHGGWTFRNFLGESGRPTVLVRLPQTVSLNAHQLIEAASCEDEPSVVPGFGVQDLCSFQQQRTACPCQGVGLACLGWPCPWRLSIDVQTCECLWRLMWAA